MRKSALRQSSLLLRETPTAVSAHCLPFLRVVEEAIFAASTSSVCFGYVERASDPWPHACTHCQ